MSTAKKIRIVATIGPASEAPEMLEKMVRAGLDVARLNFSHGNHEEHQNRINNIRKAEKRVKKPITILADLAGPKIRTGDLQTETVTLEAGKKIVLTTEKIAGTAERMSVNYPDLTKDIKPGKDILINDGKQRLRVLSVKGTEITCEIIAGGTIRSRRGINLPGTMISMAVVTEKDMEDVKFAIKNKADVFAMSFVQTAQDITDFRKTLHKLGSKALIMAKIETEAAIENLDAIIDAVDAIMVARGDLAVEIGAERVPFLQKTMVKKAREKGKIVVVATQMLESMIESPVPTRAEVSDVSNAILEGADAIMLSAESAVGKYPLEAIKTMTAIDLETEQHVDHAKRVRRKYAYGNRITVPIVDAITRYAAKTAIDIEAKVIVSLTETGNSARLVGRYRTEQPLVVASPHEVTLRQVSLLYGAHAMKMPKQKTMDAAITLLRTSLVREGYAKKGDKVVLVAGRNMGVSGGTNSVCAFTV